MLLRKGRVKKQRTNFNEICKLRYIYVVSGEQKINSSELIMEKNLKKIYVGRI